MADSKITGLAALTTADPANDMLPIVDVSDNSMAASGTTKRISINNILACSPSATLASATITGDLTVDTSTLKVDSANNRVGIGTATPTAALDILGGFGTSTAAAVIRNNSAFNAANIAQLQFFVGNSFAGLEQVASIHGLNTNAASNNGGALVFSTSLNGTGTTPAERYRIGNDGTATWSVGGSTAMTLNATGLGVGVSPFYKFQSVGIAAATDASFNGSGGNLIGALLNSDVAGSGANPGVDLRRWTGTAFNHGTSYIATNSAGDTLFYNGAVASNTRATSLKMTLDASGNLLVGTTSAAGVRLDVQTATGNCIGRVKSNAAASTASFIIDYVETLGCTYIKKAASDVWIYGVQNDTSATPAFKINTASNVGVQLVSGATAWTTLSDETVKDIIEPISNAVAKVGSLRSVIGKFKTDDASKRRSFLIAQDVQSVLPEAVDVIGENNELGLRYTEVIPLLVAAIKELTAEVNALKKA